MDVKGITWVGNVYEKFETMCLEVEEVMYQDTVRYVEDQVQSVGASVKRLLRDFFPPSPLDSEQDSAEKNCPLKSDNEKSTRTVIKVSSENGEDLSVSPLNHVRCDADDSCRPSGDFARAVSSGLRSRKPKGFIGVSKSTNQSSVSGDSMNENCDYQVIEDSNKVMTNLSDEVVLIESIDSESKSLTGKKFECNIASAFKTGLENEEHDSKSSLEETIVVVKEDDLQHLICERESNKRPSKKKIRESLYSKMRSGRKQEYKQLALLHHHDNGITNKDTDNLPSRDLSEPEWEIL